MFQSFFSVHSATKAQQLGHWCQVRKPGVHAATQLNSKVFSKFDVRVLCRTLKFFHSTTGKPSLLVDFALRMVYCYAGTGLGNFCQGGIRKDVPAFYRSNIEVSLLNKLLWVTTTVPQKQNQNRQIKSDPYFHVHPESSAFVYFHPVPAKSSQFYNSCIVYCLGSFSPPTVPSNIQDWGFLTAGVLVIDETKWLTKLSGQLLNTNVNDHQDVFRMHSLEPSAGVVSDATDYICNVNTNVSLTRMQPKIHQPWRTWCLFWEQWSVGHFGDAHMSCVNQSLCVK